MPGSTNIQQWNPGANNQENDAAYIADPQRAGGAVSGTFPSQTANKLFYQVAIVCAALAQMMANKGYTVSDANFANLVGALNNILTFTDVPTIFANPTFTGDPKAPNPPVGDNDTTVATTKFVKDVLGASGGFAAAFANPGYVKFPAALGGLVVQWGLGNTGGAPQVNMPVNFPINFPTACLWVTDSCRTGTQTSSVNFSGNSWLLTGNGTYWLIAIGH